MTAAKVARGLLYLDGDSRLRHVLPEGSAAMTKRLLMEAGLLKPSRVRLYRKAWYTRYVRFVVRHTVPGQMATLALRKRFMDEEVRRVLDSGVGQVLMVGAGFDTLCLRLAPRYESVEFVELDHPATSVLKRSIAEKLGLSRANLSFVAADLSRSSLDGALEKMPWRVGAPSAVVAEGVLMYLKESEVLSFLSAVRRVVGRESHLFFTHMRLDERGRLYLGKIPSLFRVGLKLMGEPLCWGIRRADLGAFLEAQGYALAKAPDASELHALYLEPVGASDETIGDVELLAAAVSR